MTAFGVMERIKALTEEVLGARAWWGFELLSRAWARSE